MTDIQVNLRAAKIPWLGLIAVHYWFVVIEGENKERWEIWQSPYLKSPSWGHLHLNLMKNDRGVGNGDSWVEKQWQGIEAHSLGEIIRNTPIIYPYNFLYRYYPGPNSNTYVQWILDQAQINHQLSRRGLGKKYHKIMGRERRKKISHHLISHQLSAKNISPSPYLPISLSPYLPISLSPYLPISPSPPSSFLNLKPKTYFIDFS